MSLVAGTRLGPYEIQSAIGAGGMGEVYKARDTRLDRTVAIKILPTELSSDDERRTRFAREAKTIAGLNHPHICTLYDVGEHDGATFLVMELLDGEPLRARLGDTRAAVPAIVDTAIQLADALECAHAKGIVHRDIKPENIFLTARGTAKLLDFGIAKLIAEQAVATEALTVVRAGTGPLALGTLAYMSPEQARGEPLDVRTDLFSLGVVLYEMATGSPPFRGTTAGALLGEILTKAPTAPVHLNPDVPADLERLVNKLLEKDRALRYQSAADLRVDLERLRRTLNAPAPARPEQPSIVVLPFENLSPDPEQEYFCDGMTEEIITALSKIPGLRVISRNSAMTLKGTRKTARETGVLLHVGHVLEGSVRKAGQDLRINAQLIDAATDAHLWAERYAGTLDEVFSIQEKVASAIAEALKVTMAPAERQPFGARSIANARAQECYRRARHEMLFANQASFERAVRLIRQGIDSFGEHPILQVALAQMHYLAVEWGLEPRDQLLRIALDYTRRIQVSDPANAPSLLAKLERFTGSQGRAIRHFEDAVDQEPADADSLWFLSHSYSYHAGKPAAGAAVSRWLVGIDPLTVMNRYGHFAAHWAESDFSRGLAVLDDMYRREPGLRMVGLFRTHMLARLGRIDEACAAADAVVAENATDAFAIGSRAFRHALRGEREPLLALVASPARELLWTDSECPEWTAGWLALVGERERALEWLEHWVDRGSFNYPMLAHGDPLLDNLRGEARFHRLLERIRPVWEEFVPRFEPPGDAR